MSPVTRFASTVALGGFVFGFDAAVIGGIVGAVATQFDLAPWQIGLLVSAPTLSAVAASFTVGL
ncbi:MAG: MFS transporter, partial [Pseudomonadota bacterium]|nr:MFS transporter [Pseudomonadota bacterium]